MVAPKAPQGPQFSLLESIVNPIIAIFSQNQRLFTGGSGDTKFDSTDSSDDSTDNRVTRVSRVSRISRVSSKVSRVRRASRLS